MAASRTPRASAPARKTLASTAGRQVRCICSRAAGGCGRGFVTQKHAAGGAYPKRCPSCNRAIRAEKSRGYCATYRAKQRRLKKRTAAASAARARS